MMGMAIMCGQCATLVLAMGSVRGSSILLRKTATPLLCRSLRMAGAVLLGLSLLLQIRTMETPVIAAITWTGLASIETILTALACTVVNTIRNARN